MDAILTILIGVLWAMPMMWQSLHRLKHMLRLCEEYDVEYHIKLNPLIN